jgi:phosphomannomutase
VESLGRSAVFVPVDTEAVRPEDVAMARDWAASGRFDALVSADGDGDRPLVSDAAGNWLRGDVAGVLCARFLGADAVVTPVSSNTAVEKSGWFGRVVRTRIGSPFVIEGMAAAQAEGFSRVAGYEANGGFLTATAFERDGRRLPPLPTRDALIVPLAILLMAREAGGVAALLRGLPPRFTASDRLKAFPTERSRAILAGLDPAAGQGLAPFEAAFGHLCGPAEAADTTDGLRVTFKNEEVVHLRPSGNAPEFRCYVETDAEARSRELLAGCMAVLEGWARE